MDAGESLAALGAASRIGLAVRPGVVYSANGSARIGVAVGQYVVYAGRGFEYGIDAARLTLQPGEAAKRRLSIRREVALDGYVPCDTHVHSLTGSGHGDATLDERVVAIAGEGIELVVAAEHNRQDDWKQAAIRNGVDRWFTAVVGNEVTTDLGHFNVFPLPVGGALPDHKAKDWPALFTSIRRVGGADAAVILNHARDRRKDFAPFGTERYVSLAGEGLRGWKLGANAMEVVNSGAQRNEPMDLIRDWMGAVNAGVVLTPIGASDSHDVSRCIVGQGRTYIRAERRSPYAVEVKSAFKNLRVGRVLVSCVLVAALTVNGKSVAGDLAPRSDSYTASIRVLGPPWTKADRVELYANGIKLREERIAGRIGKRVLWSGDWTLPTFKHDVFLTVVASGPGIRELYWPFAKPYQPTSPIVDSRVLGVSGAVWIDGDGDGKRSTAADYARRLKESAGSDLGKPTSALVDYNEAVSVQAASLLPRRRESRRAVKKASHGKKASKSTRFRTAFPRGRSARRSSAGVGCAAGSSRAKSPIPSTTAFIVVRDGKKITGLLRIEGSQKVWTDQGAP